MRIAIIGAGAAGCFCAVNIKRLHSHCDVEIFESGTRPLAKVAVTGGGRCNLTNTFQDITRLSDAYPRGDKLMRRALSVFSHEDTMEWFEREGVALTIQEDGCVFPKSQDAMEIVDTLLHLCRKEGIVLHLRTRVNIEELTSGYSVDGKPFDKIVICIGGCNRLSRLDFLSPFHLDIVPPVPSLFTFNVTGDWQRQLMGTVVDDVTVSLAGTKFRSRGPLLLTHWGMSGPSILKLSSYSARYLAENEYKGVMNINWCGGKNEEDIRYEIADMMLTNERKLITNAYPTYLSQEHWTILLDRANIPHTQRWGALNRKHVNRLVTVLSSDVYQITGRPHFKEEFVTAGGISLSNINIKTLEAKHHPGLYFAGEVLDVDAVTGGFNLQAAWSMAYVVASEVGQERDNGK